MGEQQFAEEQKKQNANLKQLEEAHKKAQVAAEAEKKRLQAERDADKKALEATLKIIEDERARLAEDRQKRIDAHKSAEEERRRNEGQQEKKNIVAKKVNKSDMSEEGRDTGSRALADLIYYAYRSEDWLMLGHSFNGNSMIVVKPGPWVKKATGWKRVWSDAGSLNSMDYDIYVPTCGDSNFLALGVVCVFRNRGHQEPPANSPFACVHKDICQTVSLGSILWKDAGSLAPTDIPLNDVPFMGTMWPSISTLWNPGQPH